MVAMDNKIPNILQDSSLEGSTYVNNNEEAWRKINIFNSMVAMDDEVPNIVEFFSLEGSTKAYNNE
jgi:hypothetical protein